MHKALEDTDTTNHERLLTQLGELQHSYELAGGYDVHHEAQAILSGLGFKTTDYERALSEFSGGWLMGAELAKLLLTNRICCCWTSRPTTSTWKRKSGSKNTCRPTAAP